MQFSAILKKKYGKKAVLEVGFFESQYPDGTPVASVAFWNEYGTDKTPPRPFMRETVSKKKKEWSTFIAKALKSTDSKKALALLGEKSVADIRATIKKGSFQANSPKTVKAKGFDTPLIDTAFMLRSVDWRIK